MTGRPQADSPSWEGPLYAIDVPNPDKPGEYQLFHLNTTQEGHDLMVKRLEEKGADFKARTGAEVAL
jgi:hypothetical protein